MMRSGHRGKKNLQFSHALETVEQLSDSLDHMHKKWDMFNSQMYLPKTDVFERIGVELKDLSDNIKMMQMTLLDIDEKKIDRQYFSGNPVVVMKDVMPRDEINRLKILKLKKLQYTQSELELIRNEDGFIDQLAHLNYIKNTIYKEVEEISDTLNALNYSFNGRLSGILSPETNSFSKDISMKKFSEVQLIYDSAETLMKDYYESPADKPIYNGLVVFGFRNRAVAYPTSITVFPAYAEYDLEYLTILAHEAFHIYQNNIMRNSETHPQQYEKLTRISNSLNSVFSEVVDFYSPEDSRDKNTPKEKIEEEITSELMADIYATYVAGPAYPKMLHDYYIPILFDTMVDRDTNLKYSAFRIGSLKLLVSLLTLKIINGSRGKPYGKIYHKIQRKRIAWENFSLNLARIQGLDDYTKIFNKPINEVIEKANREIIEKKCIEKMGELVSSKFYPDDISNERMDRMMSEVRIIFGKEPKYRDVLEIWNGNSTKFHMNDGWFQPRHLISLLALNPQLNRNAILIALSHHPNITGRYAKVQIS